MCLFGFRKLVVSSWVSNTLYQYIYFSAGLQKTIRRRLLKVAEEELGLYSRAAAYTWPGGCGGVWGTGGRAVRGSGRKKEVSGVAFDSPNQWLRRKKKSPERREK